MMGKEEDVITIDLLHLAKALWRRAWFLLFSMILGGALALAGALLFFTPVYKASVLLYVTSTDTSLGTPKGSISQSELTAAKSLIDTYTVILNARTTLDAVMERSGVSCGYEELQKRISAEAVNETEVFRIEVKAPDPAEAAKLANTVAQVLPEKIASLVEGSSVRIVDTAQVPEKQASPGCLIPFVIGMFLGFVLFAGVITIGEITDDRIHGPDDLLRICDFPILAVIPDLPAARKSAERNKRNRASEYAIGPELDIDGAEAYRLLRTNLNFILPDKSGCRVIGITSSLHREGKSAAAVNLAWAMAQTGSRILLLECDLRLPTLGKRMEARQAPGLSNVLAGKSTAKAVIQKTKRIQGLWLVTAGDIPSNPAELLGSDRMKALLKGMSGVFDAIIVDLPPVAGVSDSLVLAGMMDGVVLVTVQNHCRQSSLQQSILQLQFAGARILGTVMTGAEPMEAFSLKRTACV